MDASTEKIQKTWRLGGKRYFFNPTKLLKNLDRAVDTVLEKLLPWAIVGTLVYMIWMINVLLNTLRG